MTKPENDPNIYLHPDGSYRDYPPETDESGTLAEAGEDTGAQAPGDDSGEPPVSPESEQAPATTDTAQTREQ